MLVVGKGSGGWWKGKGKGKEGGKGGAGREGVSDSIGEWRGLVIGFPARAELVGLQEEKGGGGR